MNLIKKSFATLILVLVLFPEASFGKNKTDGPDITIKGAYFFSLNENNKKVYFVLEITNRGTTDATIDSLMYNCRLSEGTSNGIWVGAGGQKLSRTRFILKRGASKKFENVWFSYGALNLENYPYVEISLTLFGNADNTVSNNKLITRHIYQKKPPKGANIQTDVPDKNLPQLDGEGLYPDLELSLSNIRSKIVTNKQTDTLFKEYSFTCTIKNNSNYIVSLSNGKHLSIQSYSVQNCNDPGIIGAGGRIILQDRTKINPKEIIVLTGQTANQPVESTNRIRVELQYNGHEEKNNTANNKVCINN